jgi:DNA-directed RNA polymerase specialized sigma subunit
VPPNRKPTPLSQMPERQRLAVSLRFGDGGQPWPFAAVASTMGITTPCAYRLVRKGLAWLKANGHDVADLREPAQTPH